MPERRGVPFGNSFGKDGPGISSEIQVYFPTAPILVPGMGFTENGVRLGKGGGYYDRYLQQITGTQAVLCRTALMCDEIPMEAHDRTIDFVICEAGVLNTKNNA